MDFDKLLNDAGEVLVFDAVNYNKTQNVYGPEMIQDLLTLIRPANWKVHTYCVRCKKEETFSVSASVFLLLDRGGSAYSETAKINLPIFSFNSGDMGLVVGHSLSFPGAYIDREDFRINAHRTYLLVYTIICDFDCATAYTLILRMESDSSVGKEAIKVYKVGQIPPLYVVNSGDASEYREILSDMGAYDDYLQAIKSHQQSLEAGACCYLRRALSHMIKYYAKNNSITFEKNETTANKLKTLEEKGIITTDAKEILNPLYSDLSEGDHNLEETDNTAFYPSLLGALQFQLADAQAKRDYEKKKATVKSSLASVTKVIGSKH